MTTTQLRIVADDLTGALDSVAAFGGAIRVFLRTPGEDDGGPVAAVATATRDVPLELLPDLLASALPWLTATVAPFKKIDSLLRGNTFAEIAYLVRAGGYRGAVFAPAFPALGRVTVDGRQWLVPPGQALDRREPVGAGRPADAFAVFGLPTVGGAVLPDAGSGPVVWMPEVATDDDLAAVAAASLADGAGAWLWCGSGGLAQAIAAARGLAPVAGTFAAPAMERGPVLVMSASHHPVTRRQWDILRSAERGAMMVLRAHQASLRSTFRALGRGLDFAMFDLAPAKLLPREEAAALLARQAEAIVQQAPRPAALVVIGGDTLLTLCLAAGAHALRAGASHRPGWGFAQLEGGKWDGVPCFSRSGAFGDPDDLATMIQLLTRRNATAPDSQS